MKDCATFIVFHVSSHTIFARDCIRLYLFSVCQSGMCHHLYSSSTYLIHHQMKLESVTSKGL